MESEMIQALQTIADNIQAASQPGWVECLSIVISSISVVVSGIAIWFAIRVPKQIAEEQNKISLFEKRLQCYNALKTVIEFSRILESVGVKYESVRGGYSVYFGMDETAIQGKLSSCQPLHKLFETEMTLLGGKFLFSKEDSEIIAAIVVLLRSIYVDALLGNSEDDVCESTRSDITALCLLCKELDDSMYIIEERYLQLS